MTSKFVLGAGTPIATLLNRGFARVEERLRSEATSYPTESGADLVDNIAERPAVIHIQAVVSGNDRFGASFRPRRVWQELLRHKNAQTLLTYADPFHFYSNLVIVGMQKTQDAESGLGLRCDITLQEILQATIGEASVVQGPPLIWDTAADSLKDRVPESVLDGINADTYLGALRLGPSDSELRVRNIVGGSSRQAVFNPALANIPTSAQGRYSPDRSVGFTRPSLPRRGLIPATTRFVSGSRVIFIGNQTFTLSDQGTFVRNGREEYWDFDENQSYAVQSDDGGRFYFDAFGDKHYLN